MSGAHPHFSKQQQTRGTRKGSGVLVPLMFLPKEVLSVPPCRLHLGWLTVVIVKLRERQKRQQGCDWLISVGATGSFPARINRSWLSLPLLLGYVCVCNQERHTLSE